MDEAEDKRRTTIRIIDKEIGEALEHTDTIRLGQPVAGRTRVGVLAQQFSRGQHRYSQPLGRSRAVGVYLPSRFRDLGACDSRESSRGQAFSTRASSKSAMISSIDTEPC